MRISWRESLTVLEGCPSRGNRFREGHRLQPCHKSAFGNWLYLAGETMDGIALGVVTQALEPKNRFETRVCLCPSLNPHLSSRLRQHFREEILLRGRLPQGTVSIELRRYPTLQSLSVENGAMNLVVVAHG